MEESEERRLRIVIPIPNSHIHKLENRGPRTSAFTRAGLRWSPSALCTTALGNLVMGERVVGYARPSVKARHRNFREPQPRAENETRRKAKRQ
jgi:hypothetical protein